MMILQDFSSHAAQSPQYYKHKLKDHGKKENPEGYGVLHLVLKYLLLEMLSSDFFLRFLFRYIFLQQFQITIINFEIKQQRDCES